MMPRKNAASVRSHATASATCAQCVNATVRGQVAAVTDHAQCVTRAEDAAADAEDVTPAAEGGANMDSPAEVVAVVRARETAPARMPRSVVLPPSSPLPNLLAPLTGSPLAKLPCPPLPGLLQARASRLPALQSSKPPKHPP
jgi:hypothetical protein